jgi:hypothetical protein
LFTKRFAVPEKELEIDTEKVGRVTWVAEALPGHVREAGGDHSTDENRIIIENLYSYGDPRAAGFRKHLEGKIKGVGTALLYFPAKEARDAGHAYVYVTGAKRQAWDFYRGIGFWPVGRNLRWWCIKTDKLWAKVGNAQAAWAGMPQGQNVARRPANPFVQYLSQLVKTPGADAELDDPRDWRPKTEELFTGRKMRPTAAGAYAPKPK